MTFRTTGKFTFMLAAGILALAFTPASAANLLVNGDFASGAFTPWTIVGAPPNDGQNTVVINYPTGAYYPFGAFGEAVPQDPNTTSPYGAYLVSDVPAGGGIIQNYNAPSAGRYTVSFDYYVPNNGFYNPLDAIVSAYSNADLLTSYSAEAVDGAGTHWRTYSTDVVLGAGSNSISFLLNVPGNYTGNVQTSDQWAADFIIADVSVMAVPEPATWTMLLLGFGALGWTLRSRRTLGARTAG